MALLLRPHSAALAAILALAFAARWPFRSAPLVRDEGEYAHMAQEILRGAVPYLDVYNQKTPFVFYFFSGVVEWAGASVAALRLATTLWGLLTALLVHALARRAFGGVAAPLVATAAFCVMTFDQAGVIHPSSTEFFLLLWLAGGALLWLRPAGPLPALCAGVCAGMAYQTKQTGAVLLAWMAAEAAWRVIASRDLGTLRSQAARASIAVAGFAAVWLTTAGLFAAQGALAPYLECTWTNNLQYVGERYGGALGLLGLFGRVVTSFARVDALLWLMGGVSLLALAVWRPRGHGPALLLLWLACLASGLVAGNLYVQYWLPFIVPSSLGVGIGSAWLLGRARRGPGHLRLLALAILVVPWLPPAWHAARNLIDPAATLRARVATLPPAGDVAEVARFLAERTDPGEPIQVIGSEPQVYFLADRPSASRMAHTYPMTGPYSFAPRLRRDYLDALRDEGPRYVLFVKLTPSLSEWRARAMQFGRDAEAVLREHYHEERRFPDVKGGQQKGPLVVLRRIADAEPGASTP